MPGRSYDTPCSSIPPWLPFNLEPDEHWHYNEPNNHCPMRTFPSQTWTCSSWHQATVKMANHCDLGDDKAQTSMVGGDPPPRGASRNLPNK